MEPTGLTPLFFAFVSTGVGTKVKADRKDSIDAMRYLLEVSRDIDDFDTWRWRHLDLYISDSTPNTNWFWDHAMGNFSGSELLVFQAMIFRDIVRNSRSDYQVLVPKMAKSSLLLENILGGNIDAFSHLWHAHDSTESQKLGSRYIALLKSLGVDFKRSIEAELEKLPGRILRGISVGSLNQRILFYQDDGQAWVLRWEWILNKDAPGYALLSEFPSMTVDILGIQCNLPWPFFLPSGIFSRHDRYQEGPKWDAPRAPRARRARRLAKTARKELARTGQKRPRSRMPGAWM
jgi:hypothetical protein